jgi:hypothetical protein
MSLLKRSDIKEKDDYKFEDVHVPEWGGDVRVKGLMGHERDAYEQSIMSMTRSGRLLPHLTNARAKLVVAAAIDEEGKPLFTNNDIKWLSKKSALALSRCSDTAQKLAGLTNEDLEELLGNSEADQNEDSTSASLSLAGEQT